MRFFFSELCDYALRPELYDFASAHNSGSPGIPYEFYAGLFSGVNLSMYERNRRLTFSYVISTSQRLSGFPILLLLF